ncbi:MAG: DUF4062 domain-containing protein [Chloroflexi bacterium]|nr:DUF4062 domain-containing protein [Chloroflexota bacterium]
MTVSKPRIFISSTIYDFRDLRSALKYWLERLGYDVLLSEFNDFTKPLDENSLNACLQAVTQSDYYVLFIGSRVGGYYSSADKVSITRKEYRTAYELMKTKKLKVVVFVREELWKVREDRKALKAFLEKDLATRKEISPSDVQEIVSHSSDIVNDAEAIFGFLDEVTRANEMKDAIEGKGPFPIGNWVHAYSTFQDVIDVLSIEVGITDSLSRVALIENLKRELYSNLIQVTEKYKETISPVHHWASFARQHLTSDYDGLSQMPGRYLRWLVMYALVGGKGYGLSTRFIDHALISGEFLEYDPDLHTYRSSQINNALFELRENIDRLRFMGSSSRDAFMNFAEKYKHLLKIEGDVPVSNSDLLVPLALADCQQNIVDLTVALIKALDGNAKMLSELHLNPTSPLLTEAERIKNETPNLDEIIKWVNEI